MILYDFLQADKPCLSDIVREISFLFQRDAVCRAHLQNTVMVSQFIDLVKVIIHELMYSCFVHFSRIHKEQVHVNFQGHYT